MRHGPTARLLMVKRAGAHGAGKWSVPGGWMEQWEHPWDTAEREVMEETGVAVKAFRSLGFTDSQHPDEGIHAVTLWIACRAVDDLGDEPTRLPISTVPEPDKCPQVEWVGIFDVADYDLWFPLNHVWQRYLIDGAIPGYR